jgi:hypothetical protein
MLFLPKQPGPLQYAEMFGNRRQRHIEWIGQCSDGAVAARELFENRPSRRISERRKGGVQDS